MRNEPWRLQKWKRRITPEQAIEIVKQKSIIEGKVVYFGLNKFNGNLELFRSKPEEMKAPPLDAIQLGEVLDKDNLFLTAHKTFIGIWTRPDIAKSLFEEP